LIHYISTMKKPKLLALILLAICHMAASPANAGFSGIFANESISQNLKPFPRWVRVTVQHPKDRKLIGNPCMGRENSCFMNSWADFISSLRNKPPLEQIKAVNSQMNRSEYVTDLANWGINNYWETPLEFLKKSGNCKDYAIAKFYSLKELGFPEDDMRIVVLMDNNIHILHSVLVVKFHGQELVLDNQVKQIVSSDKIYHYEPIYAVNETGWWRYQ